MAKSQFIELPVQGGKALAVVCTVCRRIFAARNESHLKIAKASHKCSAKPKSKPEKSE